MCQRGSLGSEDASMTLEIMRYLLQRAKSGSWYIRRFLVLEYNWIWDFVCERICIALPK